MKKPFLSQVNPPTTLTEPALWFVFKNEEILLHKTTPFAKIPQLHDITTLRLDIQFQHYLGIYAGTHCFVAEALPTDTHHLPNDMAFEHLRQSYELVQDEDFFLIASRARQILSWDKNTQFCGHCGQKTQAHVEERAKICPDCKTIIYPQISPVVMALIWRNHEILLARSPHFAPYSVLAGFVEPGETLEQALIREVYEEVGLSVKNIRYFGSQPWPFPSNLMIGFICEYASGEIKIDPKEIEEAQWFAIDKLPLLLPKSISLSRRLIDGFLHKGVKT